MAEIKYGTTSRRLIRKKIEDKPMRVICCLERKQNECYSCCVSGGDRLNGITDCIPNQSQKRPLNGTVSREGNTESQTLPGQSFPAGLILRNKVAVDPEWGVSNGLGGLEGKKKGTKPRPSAFLWKINKSYFQARRDKA